MLRSMRTVTTYAFPPVRDETFEPLVEALDHPWVPNVSAFRWDEPKDTAATPEDRNPSTEHQPKGAAANPSDRLDRRDEDVTDRQRQRNKGGAEKPEHGKSRDSA
ncbi:hypothetical protein [Sphingomonas jatrophae]|uniref:hypothetical protein n=1 Tax=Sphingomonas jatrophae TaxID=1166337 RepID=UPI0010427478|nr:hypothetical protein [Sphingomonas jatrophae]